MRQLLNSIQLFSSRRSKWGQRPLERSFTMQLQAPSLQPPNLPVPAPPLPQTLPKSTMMTQSVHPSSSTSSFNKGLSSWLFSVRWIRGGEDNWSRWSQRARTLIAFLRSAFFPCWGSGRWTRIGTGRRKGRRTRLSTPLGLVVTSSLGRRMPSGTWRRAVRKWRGRSGYRYALCSQPAPLAAIVYPYKVAPSTDFPSSTYWMSVNSRRAFHNSRKSRSRVNAPCFWSGSVWLGLGRAQTSEGLELFWDTLRYPFLGTHHSLWVVPALSIMWRFEACILALEPSVVMTTWVFTLSFWWFLELFNSF